MIRPLTADDVDAFTELSLEGIRLFPNAFLRTEAEQSATPREQAAQRLASGWIHGVFDGARLIAFGGLDIRPWEMARHRGHIGPVYVTPDAQGTGTADALMAYFEDIAKSRGVTQLELWVATENTRARAFYARHGFRTKGRMPAAVISQGTPRDDLFMVRDLTQPRPEPGATDGIRRLTPGDWRAFRDIRLEMLETAPTGFGSTLAEWSAKAPDEIAGWLDRIAVWADLDAGRIIATAAWHRMPGAVQAHRGHVIAVYARPECRGQGRVATLLGKVAEDARARDIVQLELDVGADNHAARTAYERAGFTVTGAIPGALNHGGVISDQLYMVRPLDGA